MITFPNPAFYWLFFFKDKTQPNTVISICYKSFRSSLGLSLCGQPLIFSIYLFRCFFGHVCIPWIWNNLETVFESCLLGFKLFGAQAEFPPNALKLRYFFLVLWWFFKILFVLLITLIQKRYINTENENWKLRFRKKIVFNFVPIWKFLPGPSSPSLSLQLA